MGLWIVIMGSTTEMRTLGMIPTLSIVPLLAMNWTLGRYMGALRAESHERGRRIGAESIAHELQRRIAELSQRESQTDGDSEDECPNCRASYAMGFQAACLVADEAASNLQSDVPAQRSRHLKLVDQGRGTD
jgi:hypothetical protein